MQTLGIYKGPDVLPSRRNQLRIPSGELTCDRDKLCRCKIGSEIPEIFGARAGGCERQSDVRGLKDSLTEMYRAMRHERKRHGKTLYPFRGTIREKSR